MMQRFRMAFMTSILITALSLLVRPAWASDCYFFSEEVGFVCDAEPPQPLFVEPEPFADSFLDEIQYARLHDLINVYSSPSLASPIVRNVGDGFLYVTIRTPILGDDGLVWYMINFGEYVQGKDLTLVNHSQFTGYQVNAQPQRPFAWMITDYWASDEPGGEPVGSKLPRYTFFEIHDAVKDSEGWIWYDMGNGRWMRQTYVSIVDPKPRPAEVGPDEYWVEIDLYEQSFAAYEGDRMVYTGLVSSGLNRWPTHQGLFQVWERHLATKMSGAEGKIDYYFIEDVPHTMYFDDDIALHGAYWHDRFGYKHSHGCVNMPPRAAEWIYKWSEDAPNDLWVWVHESDPEAIFNRLDPTHTFAGP